MSLSTLRVVMVALDRVQSSIIDDLGNFASERLGEREKEKGTFNSPPSVHLITTDNQSIIVYMICYLAISHKICRRARFLFFYHTHKAFVGTVLLLQLNRLRIQKFMRVQKSGSTIHVARTLFDVSY